MIFLRTKHISAYTYTCFLQICTSLHQEVSHQHRLLEKHSIPNRPYFLRRKRRKYSTRFRKPTQHPVNLRWQLITKKNWQDRNNYLKGSFPGVLSKWNFFKLSKFWRKLLETNRNFLRQQRAFVIDDHIPITTNFRGRERYERSASVYNNKS